MTEAPSTPRRASVAAAWLTSLTLAVVPAIARAAGDLAVVVVGSAPAVGPLQRDLEALLRQLHVELQSAEALSARWAPPTVAAAEPLRQAARLLHQAQAAYYADHLAELEGVLADYESLASTACALDPVELLLWRAALALARDDPGAGVEWALKALRLAPDLVVDLGVFRPSLRELVDRARTGLGETVALRVASWPASARVCIDGRVVSGTVSVVLGRHRLEVSAPGFRPWRDELVITEATALDIALPLALAPRLAAAFAPGAPAAGWAGGLTALRQTAGVACVALVAPGPGSGSWQPSARCGELYEVGPASLTSAAELAAWIHERLDRLPAPASEVEPRESVQVPWRLRVGAGAGMAQRTRRVSASGGSMGEAMPGVALRLDTEVESPIGLIAELEGSVGVYPADIVVAVDDVELRVPGGNGVSARLGAAYAMPLTRVAWRLGVGAAWEGYFAPDVAFDARPTGTLPSSSSWAIDLRTWLELPVLESASVGTWSVGAGAGVSPVRFHQEFPVGATGRFDTPAPQWSASWALRASWRGAVELGFSYVGGWRRLQFRGVAGAPFVPKVRAAVVDELTHLMVLTVAFSWSG